MDDLAAEVWARSRSKTRNNTEQRRETSLTPPSYSVVENKRGDLVNPVLKVKWPERPAKGRHSVQGYLRRKRAKEHGQKVERTENSSSCSDSIDEADRSAIPVAKKLKSRFVGIKPESKLRTYLKPTESVLYYQQPEEYFTIADIPLSYPLMFAYMSCEGKIYSYRVKETKGRDGAKMWQVYVKDKNLPDQPVFRSLDAMLNYYHTFAIMFKENGRVESFPIPNH
ncbi:unnamed protein product [Bursaphelenchus okinawaensis]|uniref:SH2 domain-containing protein n=1 Tax=Bursaphelenchus okinawaensis TaxID=465554 RepID=A0A811LRR5_9BILA|nr:unnamed protein product [Bursaphelenchus okinawaensis]CAG9128341.1 unnamed protein product [Bursaphelenchus okinawaensis]